MNDFSRQKVFPLSRGQWELSPRSRLSFERPAAVSRSGSRAHDLSLHQPVARQPG